jgi:predicted nuclease of restriction endonuclease-like (RecB) superfamily
VKTKKLDRVNSGSLVEKDSLNTAVYASLLEEVKGRIRAAQVRASLAANRELILLYWSIGRIIIDRQKKEGWGASVIPRLALDLHNDLPEVKGYSERNIGYMVGFALEYGDPLILQRAVAKMAEDTIEVKSAGNIDRSDRFMILQRLVAKLPWGHNILLMEKIKDHTIRLWYAQQTMEKGWSRDVLAMMIEGRAHARQGKAVTNFSLTLPPPLSDLAEQTLKNPYLFDFLTLEKPFHERELETGLLAHLERFLLELGAGFAFVGRQVKLEVGNDDFYIDLLFYHLRLRSYVVIELKAGAFKAEYAGKMNFYLSAVDDKLRHEQDNSSIGLILCQDKNKTLAEYALRGMKAAIGVSEYQLTRALPKELRSSLPSIEEIEKELGGGKKGNGKKKVGGR